MIRTYEAISPTVTSYGMNIKRQGNTVQSSTVYGTTEEFQKTSQINLVEGRFMNEMDVKAGRKVCIIGQDIIKELFPFESAVNKEIKISGIPFQVIGVMEKQGSGFMGSFSMDGMIIMPLKAFVSLTGDVGGRLRIDIKVGDVELLEEAKQEVISAMRVIRKVPPGKEDDFAVNQQEAFKQMYDSTVGIVAIAGIVITALSLFVGAIGIMNIMFVSVTERTKEIGVRKAIGAKTWSILLQFLVEAAVICILGGIIGLILSYPLSLVINQFLPTSLPLHIAVLAILISALVGLISGFLPAWRASRLNPVDALRYE
jgi:putative ABC transport system permease protein